MYICYLDESGVPEAGAGTSHFVLAGVAIPAIRWKQLDGEIACLKAKFALENDEIHTGWMMRRYIEQEKLSGFINMDRNKRRQEVKKARETALRLAAATKPGKYLYEIAKNYKKTDPYIHLTLDERRDCLREICDTVGNWHDARLFAEAFDKAALSTRPSHLPSLYEDAFTQVISRFQAFLVNRGNYLGDQIHGLIVQDNNKTVEEKLTRVMRNYHKNGTLWTDFNRIVETPLFVDSRLTSMVQIADVCSYAIRRFFENVEEDLLNRIYGRFDRVGPTVVGIRHYTIHKMCRCRVCIDHSRTPLFP